MIGPQKSHTTGSGRGEELAYCIQVRGVLDEKWSDWLGGFSITAQPDGNTVLTGRVPDQAALYGLLNRLRDLGLSLVSVKQLDEMAGA